MTWNFPHFRGAIWSSHIWNRLLISAEVASLAEGDVALIGDNTCLFSPTQTPTATAFPTETTEPRGRPSSTPSLQPSHLCPMTCFGWSCDGWSQFGWSCPEMEGYDCDCKGCECPIDTPSPTVSILPTLHRGCYSSGCCDTTNGTVDWRGLTCGAYTSSTRFSVNATCGFFDTGNFSALDMCCLCGGGFQPPSIAPTATFLPTGLPTYPPNFCTDP